MPKSKKLIFAMRSQNSILLETQFFPPISYVSALIKHRSSGTEFSQTQAFSTTLILEKNEHFLKGSYRNRCHIATAQGVQILSVPLKKGKNKQQLITDVQISNDIHWQRPLWRTLQTAYGNAPFWEHYAPIIEPFFVKQYNFLFDYNFAILQTILKILKYHTSITLTFTETYNPVYTITPERDGDEGNKVLDLRNHFTPKNETGNPKRYAQVFEDRNGFIPHLSILDLIFCSGNQSLDILTS